jgi:hypothetical protein
MSVLRPVQGYFIPSHKLAKLYQYQQTRPPEKQYSGRFKTILAILREFLDRW